MRARTNREIRAALEASEVQPRESAAARRQRTLEAVADPQLIASRAAEKPDVRSDALLDLHAFLQDAVFVADEAAAKQRRLKESRRLQREKSGIGVLKPLRMRRRRARQSAQSQREGDYHPNAGNQIFHHVSTSSLRPYAGAPAMPSHRRHAHAYRTCRYRCSARSRRRSRE